MAGRCRAPQAPSTSRRSRSAPAPLTWGWARAAFWASRAPVGESRASACPRSGWDGTSWNSTRARPAPTSPPAASSSCRTVMPHAPARRCR
ncbi:hypothetical protein [Ornithinimicrobium kibberense]|uniref:hypothetical protein n=1 Tax=Ornithinimicrobium kibberense TaxID=282060 RepID=UPI003614A7F0